MNHKTEQTVENGQAPQAAQEPQGSEAAQEAQEAQGIEEAQEAQEAKNIETAPQTANAEKTAEPQANKSTAHDPLADIGRDIQQPSPVEDDSPHPQQPATAKEEADKKPTAEEQLATLNDKFLRLAAELENTRRRATRDRSEALKYGIASFARDMVAVSDNLTRALSSIDEDARTQLPENASNLLAGVAATQRDLMAALERHGIVKMTPLGEKFDPNLHEAMFETAFADKENGTIIEVVETGFMIGERLLRAAKVGIVKNPTDSKTPPETPNPDTKVDD